MLTTGTQNLPEPLARVQAAYHGTVRLAPASADRLARRVEHFASSVQFVLEDSDAARRLHALTKDLHTIPRLGRPDVSVPFELWVMGRTTVSLARRAGRQGPARPARQARLRGRSP
jgi:hypothetical protein